MNHRKTEDLIFNLSILLNAALLVLMLADSALNMPVPLQIAGRLHPLVLHFPIVLILLAVLILLPGKAGRQQVVSAGHRDLFLAATSLLAAFTALSGLFLAQEEGYSPEALNAHRFLGAGVSFATLLWYIFRCLLQRIRALAYASGALMMVLLTAAGHQGAILTHGKGFITAPLEALNRKPSSISGEENLFSHIIYPVLDNKCLSCHNSYSAKGGLNLESPEHILAGGKSGKLWDDRPGSEGLLIHRLLLPPDDKKHMPPAGKKQLTTEELNTLVAWVKAGASFDITLGDLAESDSLRILAGNILGTANPEKPFFKPVPTGKLEELSSVYTDVQPLYKGSGEIAVTFTSAENFDRQDLIRLAEIGENITALNLTGISLSHDDLKTIAGFNNLEKLNMSFSSVSGADIAVLNNLGRLRHLSLTGTKVTAADLQALTGLSRLTALYVWETEISDADLPGLRMLFPDAGIETGVPFEEASPALSEHPQQ